MRPSYGSVLDANDACPTVIPTKIHEMTRLRCLQVGGKAINPSVPFQLLLLATLLHSAAAATVQTVAFQQGRQLSSGVYNGTKDCQINTQYADTWNYGNGGAAFYQSGSQGCPQPDCSGLAPQLCTADVPERNSVHREGGCHNCQHGAQVPFQCHSASFTSSCVCSLHPTIRLPGQPPFEPAINRVATSAPLSARFD
jgi:hypothetical protein